MNVEDELYLAVALGCQMEIMRSVYDKGLNDWDDSDRDYTAEAGEFELYIGGNSRDCLRSAFELVNKVKNKEL